MPSDPRIDQDKRVDLVARALSEPLERFRSALATAVEQLRTYLATHRPEDGGAQDEPEAAQDHTRLGVFAQGRIDTARFATLLKKQEAVDVGTLTRMERSFDALAAMAAGEDELWSVTLSPGDDLRYAVAVALGRIGRAFGAARVAELSRSGRYDDAQHASLMDSLPFPQWTARERELAPPLVVRVDGGDVRAAGLTDFLDGSLKIVLVVRGDAPSAPLVRMISPGMFVLQTCDENGLERLGAWNGPGIAALLPETAARFVHDPAGGPRISDRLQVAHLPQDEPPARIGGVSASQQLEDLRQLVVLIEAATPPPAPPEPEPAPAAMAEPVAAQPAAAQPADQLAAWLLAQADLPQENVQGTA